MTVLFGDISSGAVGSRSGEYYLSGLEAVATWGRITQGAMSMPIGLRKIADKLGADISATARIELQDGTSSTAQPARSRVVAFDRRANFVGEVSGFRISYAEGVCGRHIGSAKPGTIWMARTSDFEHDTRLHAPLRHRQLVQTIVIALQRNGATSDFLELHFPEEISPELNDQLTMLGPVLSESWKSRKMGILSHNVLDALERNRKNNTNPHKDVLAVDNPCRLSRAEYRVCLMLSRGLDKTALLDELSISLSTLRSHMRNIYAKTDTHSQSELLQLLLVRPRDAIRLGLYNVA